MGLYAAGLSSLVLNWHWHDWTDGQKVVGGGCRQGQRAQAHLAPIPRKPQREFHECEDRSAVPGGSSLPLPPEQGKEETRAAKKLVLDPFVADE